VGRFFRRLQAQSDANARRALQTYADELQEYRRVMADPVLGRWLAEVATQLSTGPDLVITLSAYCRHDMNRTEAARSLRIRPRTLDYRLQRVRELTGWRQAPPAACGSSARPSPGCWPATAPLPELCLFAADFADTYGVMAG
jgi:PucR-like helix-turn-helix protein